MDNTEDVLFLNKPQHLILNFWTPTFSRWGDELDDSDMPWYTKYDFVRVEWYNSEHHNFEFYWQDDFDSFNNDHWYKSELWSFDGNSSKFFGSQVSVEDGNLVLKLEKKPSSFSEITQ